MSNMNFTRVCNYRVYYYSPRLLYHNVHHFIHIHDVVRFVEPEGTPTRVSHRR